ncbi:MAG: preprotein translocase subunit YajC [Zetaproteobacteria bacterium CG1_02_55_237]|nr:MAG: preprotein translocase subunit YajC [Zetaproteobacteria bacterium CG1_02_55_237]
MNHINRFLSHTGAAAGILLALSPNALAAAEPMGGGIAQLVPLVLIIVIFYFLLIRPQQKRLKAHQAMIGELKKGDKVLTSGGIIGTVQDVSEDTLRIEIADKVRVTVKRDTITSLAD